MAEDAEKATTEDGEGSQDSPNVAAIPDEFGALVLAECAELDRFAEDWETAHGPGSTVALSPDVATKNALSVASTVLGSKATAARYVLGSELWRQANKPASGTVVTYHRMTRSASSGKILANPRIAPAAAVPGAGEIVLALAALEVALDQMADRIEARLDVIEDKVDEILRLASAQRLGDVYGHQRLLKRRLAEVTAGHTLTDTDWSSMAVLGTDLEVGVERLRFHALHLLAELRVDDSADDRADQLQAAVTNGRLCETLQLLLVAQQSLYIWQKLRLHRVCTAEPSFLGQTIESARTTLKEHLHADRDMATQLRSTLDRHAVLRVTEIHHQLAGRKLSKYRQPLAEMVDKFIEARSLQVDAWLGTEHAGFRDALGAAQIRAAKLTRVGRKRLALGTSRVANWLEPNDESSKIDDETGTEPD